MQGGISKSRLWRCVTLGYRWGSEIPSYNFSTQNRQGFAAQAGPA